VKLGAAIVGALVLGLLVWLQYEEILALRGERDRALAACPSD
jgi:hypothetical protein